ncbi:alanyl-tRNA editing protein [Paenibacillus sp. EC2-1]|uniref:alanyl-tRNA editing protein n=1 Tax=Paenibacillus sp. EC2-1 TaxID=3388665 RepID=UPI003BEF02E1
MTQKLYYDSAYLKQWKTTVSKTLEKPDGHYVILEETAFYPHGGGQPCDLGYIEGVPVLDVIKEDDLILHKIESIPEAKEVTCEIDWNRRFDHMQQHSGQHLLSAVCLDLYQATTLSFHLGTDYCTIDVEAKELSAIELDAIEREVNLRIYQNHPILSYWVSEEEMKSLNLVKQPKVTDHIRIVEIKEVEYNACGGTHVSATGEIGMIKLLKTEKQKGNIRIYFKCGFRALAEFNDSQQILGALTTKFKTGKDEIMERIVKWEQEQKELQAEVAILKEKNNEFIAEQLLDGSDHGVVTYIFDDKSLKELQSLASMITSKSESYVLLASSLENKVVLAHNNSSSQSCGAFFKSHLTPYSGKGGGSEKMAQAAFPSWEEAHAFYEFAVTHLQA